MKVYLKRDNSSDASRYIVYDELGLPKYTIIGRHSTSGERMYIMSGDTRVAKMRDTHLGVLRSCVVSTATDSAHIVITQRGANISITFHGICWHIRGDVLLKSYDILDVDNSLVAVVSDDTAHTRDSSLLNIYKENKELLCIASAVCVDSIATMAVPAMQMS